MTEWIEWKGGECPVPEGTLIDVKDRDGEVWVSTPALSYTNYTIHWDWTAREPRDEIIAYRILSSGPPPLS